MFEIEAIPAFDDNYIWLIKNKTTMQLAVVDPGDATPVLDWLQQHPKWQLSDILITHHHKDHTGGVLSLVEHTDAIVSAPNSPSIPHKDNILTNNQQINVVGRVAEIIAVPGHTLDHIVYFFPEQLNNTQPWLFSGDTLFSGGCGRVFEGTMDQMYQSLQHLNKLPPKTLIYPAHEYTVSNLKFAMTIEPTNINLKDHLNACIKLRQDKKITLPSILSVEQQINPFLRCNQATVIAAANNHLKQTKNSPTDIFSILRAWKNKF